MIDADRFNLSRWSVTHPAFVLFLILASLAAGVDAYLGMGRAEDPSFTIKTAVVQANWPGATAEEMQLQVAERLEDKLRQTPYLDYLRTFSLPERTTILVQLRDTTPKQEVREIWYQVRKKLGDIQATLPSGVRGPYVNDEYGDVYSALYAFQGQDYEVADLKRLAESVRKRLLRIEDVEKVELIGDQAPKIFVEFSHRRLANLGVSAQQIFDGIRRQNEISPAGKIDNDRERIHVRVDGAFHAVQAIQDVAVTGGNRTLRLGDIADVRRGYEDPPDFQVRYNGKSAVALGVVMRKGGDVLAMGKALESEMQSLRSEIPLGVSVGNIAFQPHVVEESVTEFLRSFAEALVIVLVVSFLSLGIRTGIVVALSIPSVLALTLVVMRVIGMDLDRISLGALILALGLLVDDAIIAVEMMAVKLEQGWSRMDAATFAWKSTAFPMLSGTLITAAGFLPVGFARSAAGEYAGGIFWVVGISLVASWIVAVLFTPYLGYSLLPEHSGANAHNELRSKGYQTRGYNLLRAVITLCVSHPRHVVSITGVAFLAAVAGFATLQQQFFPQSSRHELIIDIKMPEGASFQATRLVVKEVEELLEERFHRARPAADHSAADHSAVARAGFSIMNWLSHSADDASADLRHYTSYIGSGSARFFLALNPDLPNPTFAKIVIQTTGTAARERMKQALTDIFAEDPRFVEPRIRVLRLDFGPPVGFPVQFRVIGRDRETLKRIGTDVRDRMRQDPAAVDVHFDWNEPSKVVRLKLDQQRIVAMGLDSKEIANTMQTLLAGAAVAEFREGTETVQVVARAIPDERLRLDSLADLTLFTSAGLPVPLGQVAKIDTELEQPIFWRRNQESMLTVRCDVRDGVQAPDVTARLSRKMAELELPPGYRIEKGGAYEESLKANQALFTMFPIMSLAMLTLLMLQVQDFKKAGLVVGIAPLGLIGAVLFLHLFQAPFGFVALLGVIALAGMDMRNSIILIDQIEQDLQHGLAPWEAVIESAVRRARPVILTAATAILAMIPLTRSVFWGPMAIAIMGGLSVATFLTLINLPALYVLLFGIRPDNAATGRA
jgi:multidrug efflux pump subunit AcrB